MLLDLRNLPDGETLELDLCIVGAGAAGLTLGYQLMGSNLRVGILESGGLDYDPETQYLYDGELVGLDYYPLDSCRLRYFGGTTNHWGGYCAPFDENDFTPNPKVAHSGWPTGMAEVAPYARRAASFIGLPEDAWSPALWAERFGISDIPLRRGVFNRRVLLIHPKRFGTALRDEFRQSENVRVFLNANVVEILTDQSGRQVTGLRAQTLDGKRAHATVRAYALCTGGIENARLLLASNRTMPAGVGNRHDLVGRFFTDHVNTLAGVLQPADPGLDLSYYDTRSLQTQDLRVEMVMEWPRLLEREEGVPPGVLRLFPAYDDGADSDGVRAARRLQRSVSEGRLPDALGSDLAAVARDLGSVFDYTLARLGYGKSLKSAEIWVRIAPLPNPDSRVTLTGEVDALGVPLPRLEWRMTPADKRTVRTMVHTFAAEAAAAGLGRVQILVWTDDDRWEERFEGSYHHIGTTRMAADPTAGVVDRDCRVHGIDNLFVGGSSVFSTPGHGTPTMMIIALAMRLADHIRERLSP